MARESFALAQRLSSMLGTLTANKTPEGFGLKYMANFLVDMMRCVLMNKKSLFFSPKIL